MYTYDANGNILTVTDAQGTITREYDALNRVAKYTDARGNSVGYGYDEIGNLIYLTYPGGEIVRCTYYKNGWIENVTTEHLDEPVKVYNFEVEDWHTYYVTEQGVLVHNEYGGLAK